MSRPTPAPSSASRLGLDSNLPILDTSLALSVTHVQNIVPIAFLMFADAQLPGLHLDFLGAPDCFSYTNANLAARRAS